MTVKLITDSTSYIDKKTLEDLDITMIPLSVHFPDESFQETAVDYEYFYAKIASSGIIPSSSQPPQEELYNAFEKIISQGNEALGIFISKEMSGTYDSALKARERILQKYPDAVIEVLNSGSNCMSLGFPVLEAARAALKGNPLHEVLATARQTISRMHFYFVPVSLEYLRKGGRIGGAAALLGSILNIKPILFVNKEGKTDLLEKIRGSKAAINRLLSLLDKDFHTSGLKHVIVHHINAPEKARELARTIAARYSLDIPITSIGPVIGLHVGPGTVGIVYCTQK